MSRQLGLADLLTWVEFARRTATRSADLQSEIDNHDYGTSPQRSAAASGEEGQPVIGGSFGRPTDVTAGILEPCSGNLFVGV